MKCVSDLCVLMMVAKIQGKNDANIDNMGRFLNADLVTSFNGWLAEKTLDLMTDVYSL